MSADVSPNELYVTPVQKVRLEQTNIFTVHSTYIILHKKNNDYQENMYVNVTQLNCLFYWTLSGKENIVEIPWPLNLVVKVTAA